MINIALLHSETALFPRLSYFSLYNLSSMFPSVFATISETKHGPSGFPLDTEPSSSLRMHPSRSQRASLSPAPLTPSIRISRPLLISSSVKLQEPVCRFRPGFQTPNNREGHSQSTISMSSGVLEWPQPGWLNWKL